MANKNLKNKKSMKKVKRRNRTRKQKGGSCSKNGNSPFVTGGTCPCNDTKKSFPFFYGGTCGKCGGVVMNGGGNANLDYVLGNPNYVIPLNNQINNPNNPGIVTSERLTVGGKKYTKIGNKKSRRRLNRGGFSSYIPSEFVNGVTSFGNSMNVSHMKDILTGTGNNYQPNGSNLYIPNNKIMV